jgi:metal-responsive CopG/Arc/MetJ family transcriptional regulator
MSRTQIYLGTEELDLLNRAARASGASRSELIRRAVRESYGAGAGTKAQRRTALRASAGSWKDHELTGAEYVDAIRGDLSERLRRLGLT